MNSVEVTPQLATPKLYLLLIKSGLTPADFELTPTDFELQYLNSKSVEVNTKWAT